MIGENIDKTAFTFSTCKKKDSIFLKIFFERYGNLPIKIKCNNHSQIHVYIWYFIW